MLGKTDFGTSLLQNKSGCLINFVVFSIDKVFVWEVA